jgi:hypothetical protein
MHLISKSTSSRFPTIFPIFREQNYFLLPYKKTPHNRFPYLSLYQINIIFYSYFIVFSLSYFYFFIHFYLDSRTLVQSAVYLLHLIIAQSSIKSKADCFHGRSLQLQQHKLLFSCIVSVQIAGNMGINHHLRSTLRVWVSNLQFNFFLDEYIFFMCVFQLLWGPVLGVSLCLDCLVLTILLEDFLLFSSIALWEETERSASQMGFLQIMLFSCLV